MAHTGLNSIAGACRRAVQDSSVRMFFGLLLATFLVLAGGIAPDAQAASPLGAVSLSSIQSADTPIWPTDIAVTPDYTVYVADEYNNKIRKFDSSGNEVASYGAAGLAPQAIAIASDGKLIVAVDGGSSVRVYDPSLPLSGAELSTLPASPAFVQVHAIAVDDSGNIYVADAAASRIAVYDSSYVQQADFSIEASAGTPISPALRRPEALAAVGGVLYVGDRPSDSTYGDTVRIMKVNLADGLLLEVFGEPVLGTNYSSIAGPSVYGFQEGQLSMAAGIQVDAGGLLYVADPAQFAIQVFDENGAYLYYLYDSSNLMRTVTSVRMLSDGHVFVGSMNTHEVKRFVLSGGFSATPASLSFTTPGDDGPKQIDVCNYDTGSGITVTANTPPSWMVLSSSAGDPATGVPIGPASGATPACETVTVSVIPGSPQPTLNFDLILTESGSGLQKTIPVTFDITGVALVCTPDYISVNAEQDRPTPVCTAITCTVSDGSAVPDPLNVQKNAPWLTVTPTGPGTFDACIDVTGLTPQTAFDTITFSDPNSGTSGIQDDTVDVYLTITAKNSYIQVTSNVAACFNITGPEWPSGSNPAFDTGTPSGDPHCVGAGATWTSPAVFSGDYTVEMQPVNPYDTPGPFSFTLNYGSTYSVNAFYSQVFIAAAMGPGLANTSQIRVYDSSFTEVGSPFTAFDAASVAYGARVAMGDVDGDLGDEIIVAKGEGAVNNTEVKVFERDGTPVTGANFVAFSSLYRHGARVAAADLDGDGRDEIVVGTSDTRPLVRVFSYDGVGVLDTGVIFNPFPAESASGNYGVNLAAADLDGDGADELITTLAGKNAPADVVKAWDVDTSGGMGAWTAVADAWSPGAILAGATEGGAAVAASAGAVAVASGAAGGSLELYDGTGALVCSAAVGDPDTRQRSGIELSSGDIDGDGLLEMVVTLGANDQSDSKVYVYEEAATTCVLDAAYHPTSTPLSALFGAGVYYGARTAVGQAE